MTFTLTVHDGIADIGREAWDACARPTGDPFVSYDFLHACEASGSAAPRQGWAPRHLALAQVGTDMNVADAQTAVLEETRLSLKTTLSNIEDLDYAEAIGQMNKQMLSLEAAQSSFGKISKLNLFNYLN